MHAGFTFVTGCFLFIRHMDTAWLAYQQEQTFYRVRQWSMARESNSLYTRMAGVFRLARLDADIN